MIKIILLTLLALNIIYALLKFFEFFYRKDATKRAGLDMVYEKLHGRPIAIYDNVMFVLMAAFVVMLFAVGADYLSLLTGLVVGMTIIQIYFHRFNKPLTPEQMPKPPLSLLKMASYSIQAMPGLAWREITFITILFVWGLYAIFSQGFGWF